jgi:hypothetical protein
MSPAPRPEMRRPSTMERENPSTRMVSTPVSIVQGTPHNSLAGSISGRQEQDPPSWHSIRANLQQQIQLNKAARGSNLAGATDESPLTPPTPNFPDVKRPETPNRSFLEDRNALAPFTGSLVGEASEGDISRVTSSGFELEDKGKGDVVLPKGMLSVEVASPRTSSLVDLYGSGDTTPVFDTTPPLAISKVDHEETSVNDGVAKEEIVKTPSVAPSLSLPALESSRPLSLGIHLHSS